jgi:hypothetical protein
LTLCAVEDDEVVVATCGDDDDDDADDDADADAGDAEGIDIVVVLAAAATTGVLLDDIAKGDDTSGVCGVLGVEIGLT